MGVCLPECMLRVCERGPVPFGAGRWGPLALSLSWRDGEDKRPAACAQSCTRDPSMLGISRPCGSRALPENLGTPTPHPFPGQVSILPQRLPVAPEPEAWG